MSKSVDWLRRQRNDPFVLERIKRGLNARSAIKLEQLDEKLKFIGKNKKTVDLGAYPGGFCQILLERGVTDIVALDLNPPPLNLREKITYIQGDFTKPNVFNVCMEELGGTRADLVLSDLAPKTTGNPQQEHALQMELCRIALEFTDKVLDPVHGSFLCKVFQGEEEEHFAREMKLRFKEFRRVKPTASRKESREIFYFGRNNGGK